MRAFGLACVIVIAGLSSVAAQDAETLADIRQDLSVLYVEIQNLKRELSTTSGATVSQGGSLLDRVTLIEGELSHLTGRTEELEFRINKIVRDGTNRIGDLEFRLVELEGGDLSQLSETTTLGGGSAALKLATVSPAPKEPSGTQMAVGEQADFNSASAQLEAEDWANAAASYGRFNETYPGSPMAIDALMGQATALAALGDTREASRAYLRAYESDPQGPQAPAALLNLGFGLQSLGQIDAACQILTQVTGAFPEADEALEAASTARNIGC